MNKIIPMSPLLPDATTLDDRKARARAWFERLRDAYLEPWGRGLTETFELALRVGAVAHAIARKRQRDFLPEAERPHAASEYAVVLRRALELAVDAPRRA